MAPRRPLSILLLYDCLYPETIGGVEHRNAQLAAALAARGHRVTLAGFADRLPPPTPGVSAFSLGCRRRGRRGAFDTLRFAIAAARLEVTPYDVVETANIPHAHLLPLAQRCRLAGIPLVVTWHEYWGRTWRRHLGPLWPLGAALENLGARIGRAVAVSRLTAERVERSRRRTVPVLPNGVPVAAVRRAAQAGASAGPPLLCAGRLLPEKRLDLLLAAVAKLPLSAGDQQLLSIVGDGPEREHLGRLAASLGIAERVRFAGRLETSEELWRQLGGARIAVHPSAREGFGLFPLEAMAAGLPVVACHSEDSAVGELVRDGVEGFVTDPTPAALAAALQRLLLDNRLRSRQAAAAARRAEQYDWEHVAGRAEEVFYGVAGASVAGDCAAPGSRA